MSSLDEMIELPANREGKSALAVKMSLFDFKTAASGGLLNVSASFVSKWKIKFETEGAEALKLNSKGGTGFLTADQRDAILFPLRRPPIAWKPVEIISKIMMEGSISRSHHTLTCARKRN